MARDPAAAASAILGDSPSVAALRDQIRHLASFDTPRNPHVPTVLLLGETGTGKGLVARVMHDSGPRASGPFIDVNCAAIPENMLEAELFGFEAGAFTDARRAKAGLFEAASGGTLFLDEIDALSVPLQSKLLKAIEEKSTRRLGALEMRRVDVKLVAATQRDLRRMVAAGSFRADLYHRLAVVVLEIPPLRERGDDVVLLAEHFLADFALSHGLEPRRLDASARAWLRARPWSGNVRELAHLMERLTLMGPHGELAAEALARLAVPLEPEAPEETAPPVAAARGRRRETTDARGEDSDEAARIRTALLRSGGNVVAAARRLGIGRNALRYRMRRLGIDRAALDELAVDAADEAPGSAGRGRFDGEPAPPPPAEPALPDAPAWENKAVAVLAIELTFPDDSASGPAWEPWTSAMHWRQRIEEKVAGFGGVFYQRTPSRLSALFGVPRTIERATERAVHAALAVRELSGPEGLVAPERRLAVHVGPVRIDTGARDPASSVLPIGDTLALPERLLGHAGTGEVLVSDAASRRVRETCSLEPRRLPVGPSEDDRIPVFAVRGLASSRGDERVEPPVRARFVGRSHELGLLESAFASASAGHGQVVFLVGEAGIGKSRLLDELAERIGGTPHRWLEGRCAPFGTRSAFVPILDGLRRFFSIDDHEDDAAAVARVDRGIAALGSDLAWTAPLVRQLLSLGGTDASIAGLDSASRRSEIFGALRALALRTAADRPVVMVIEDLHWIDPASEEYLAFFARGIPGSRVLLVCSYRPGYRQPFGEQAPHARITLLPLSTSEMASVAGSLLEVDQVPPEVSTLIARKAEGNPFFVEEVTKSLVEDGSLRRRNGSVALARDLDVIEVPDTIQEVLLARIDRLADDARRAIQVASVIGREFAVRLLARISEMGDGVQTHVDELRGLELIYEKALQPELAYMFKHALTHEVAYESVVVARRKHLHRTIGLAIEELYAERLAEHYEALAHHFERGEDWPRAFDYHCKAAEKANQTHASRAVIEHCRAALAIARQLADRVPRSVVMELEQRIAITSFYLSEFSASAAAFERAAEAAEDPEVRAFQLGSAAQSHLWAHQYSDCVRTNDAAHELAVQQGNRAVEAVTISLRGQYGAILEADLDTAADLCTRAYEIVRESGDPLARAIVGFPNLLLAEWMGHYEHALAIADRIMEDGRQTGLAHFVVWPRWFVGKARCCLGDYGGGIAILQEAAEVCERIGDVAWKGRLWNTLGWAFGEIGADAQARAWNERAIEIARRIDDVEITANAQVNLARNELHLGERERASDCLAPIEDGLSRTGDPWMRWRYGLHACNVRAELDLAAGEADRAVFGAERELAGARRHRAPKLEARALVLRGRALVAAERPHEAEASFHEALEVASRISYPRAAWEAHGELGRIASRLGRRADEEHHRVRVAELAERAAASLTDSELRSRLLASTLVSSGGRRPGP